VVGETLDGLRLELAELRASRKRLVLAADAARRRLERDLHDGVQQHLVALAVDLQVAAQSAEGNPAETGARLVELGRDVQQALDAAAQLAARIYPPLLAAGGLAAALRAAALSAGIRVSVEVAPGAGYPPELAATVYLCCLVALERVEAGAQATVTVREEDEALAFEVVGAGADAALEQLRDRVEALGGRLTSPPEPGRVAGSLPLPG
jgi:signal transduction histidine kinase